MTLYNVKLKPGFVYILRNQSLRSSIVKVGMTTLTSEERASQLSNPSSVAEKFEVLYEEAVINCVLAENLIHHQLSDFRINRNREFFDVPLKTAVKAVFETCLTVNRSTLSENSRLVLICENKKADMESLRAILLGAKTGTTRIRLILRRINAIAELDLGDATLVSCTPELLSQISRQSWIKEYALYVAAEA